MTRKKRNYARFYAIAKAKGIDLEAHKEDIVLSYTDGRTSSLREMTDSEYYEMLDCLQAGSAEERERLRRSRSNVLVRLQRLGVDTADRSFAAVNRYCMDPRIAGRPFGLLSADELDALVPKLEAIQRKQEANARARKVAAQQANRVMIYVRQGGDKPFS